jgi:predicted RNA methylase
LILLIDPDQESLGIIMENTSSLRPVSIKVACLKESISFFEKEMVIN